MEAWKNKATRLALMALTGLVVGGMGWWAMWDTGWPHIGALALVAAATCVAAVGEATGPWRDEA